MRQSQSDKTLRRSPAISIGHLEMNCGEMSPLHESALFQPKKSINDGDRSSHLKSGVKTVFTCKKCGCTDMEEEEGEEFKFREAAGSDDHKFREEAGPTPGKSNDRSSSRVSSSGSSSSSPCTNVSDEDDDDNEINVVDDEDGVENRQEQAAAAPSSSSSMSICEQLESMVTRYVIQPSGKICDC